MTGKQFMRALANGKADMVQVLLDLLAETRTAYCIIGGLAVNAYVEPVVSLDIAMVVAIDDVAAVAEAARKRGLKVEAFEHSLNIGGCQSDLRIQIQTDPRYQAFIGRAETRPVLGYTMQVAPIDDVLQGKLWAYGDAGRRRSKRQKDLADIMRIVEAYPQLKTRLPADLVKVFD